MKPLFEVGRNCCWLGPVERSAVIVDAAAYYAAFYRAASLASRQIVIAGWQFDSNVKLLRGEAASSARYPVEFLPFLNALCQERSELRVYILAWDYSLVYSLEREWLQGLRFAFQSAKAIRFEFDAHPGFGGSHHQKFAVIDGALAFAGGLDLCDERWDDRGHATPHALRVDAAGEPCRPNHEVQAAVQGEAAAALQRLFVERWQRALGETLELDIAVATPLASLDLPALDPSAVLPIRAGQLAIARTLPVELGAVREVQVLMRAALLEARQLIYIETQYFTSRSMSAALSERLRRGDLPRLQVLVVLPRGADNSKEKFALGDVQNALLSELSAVAEAGGHELRFFCSSVAGEACQTSTFIHSKVLVVDDELLCVGSANMTERSMTLDSELCLLWQGEPASEVARDIQALRASLLAEHSGQPEAELFEPVGLTGRLDAAIAAGTSRLRLTELEPASINPFKVAIFDPGEPATSASSEVAD